jgi:hypothetical protein
VPVTLIYEPHFMPTPLGQSPPDGGEFAFREAAVYATLEEALLQAGWDELCGGNRFAERVIAGAHHGSPGWAKGARRRGRPRHHDATESAHDADGELLAGEELIDAAAKIVAEHWWMDQAEMQAEARRIDAEEPGAPHPAHGTPRVPDAAARALAAIRELIA